MIDDVIEPSETRRVIVSGIEQAADKRSTGRGASTGISRYSKVVISAALTGVLSTRNQCPAIPYTPKEIAEEANEQPTRGRCDRAHPRRTADGGPDWKGETFAEIFHEVRARTDVIVNFSTGAIGVALRIASRTSETSSPRWPL